VSHWITPVEVRALTKFQDPDLPAFLEERVSYIIQSSAGFALEASYAVAAGPMTFFETMLGPVSELEI
jgi:hypothetical protein